MQDPLTQAARDAPNSLAIVSPNITFAELRNMRSASSEPLKTILQFFSDWREERPIFLPNLRFPEAQIEAARAQLKNAPPHIYLFTSGSTATPKLAALSKENLLASAAASVDLRPGDQWKLTLPLYHVGGLGILLRCMLARAALVLGDSLDVTHLSYVPTQLYRATPIYKRLRCLLLGGAPIPSLLPSLPIYTTYGLTEMGSMVTLQNQVLPHREVRIASDGEIWVRGKTLFQGYWENETLRKPFDAEGWFATGDLGRFTHRGLLIEGRKDWQFISGGENIQPEEIEKELLSLPEIEEAVVIPLSDPEFGKRPHAILKVNDKNFSLQQMKRVLSGKLPKYKIPASLLILDDLPKQGLKINRNKIFELFSK